MVYLCPNTIQFIHDLAGMCLFLLACISHCVCVLNIQDSKTSLSYYFLNC
jgi:heme A synthase